MVFNISKKEETLASKMLRKRLSSSAQKSVAGYDLSQAKKQPAPPPQEKKITALAWSMPCGLHYTEMPPASATEPPSSAFARGTQQPGGYVAITPRRFQPSDIAGGRTKAKALRLMRGCEDLRYAH
jgi:hypothetical protein